MLQGRIFGVWVENGISEATNDPNVPPTKQDYAPQPYFKLLHGNISVADFTILLKFFMQ